MWLYRYVIWPLFKDIRGTSQTTTIARALLGVGREYESVYALGFDPIVVCNHD